MLSNYLQFISVTGFIAGHLLLVKRPHSFPDRDKPNTTPTPIVQTRHASSCGFNIYRKLEKLLFSPSSSLISSGVTDATTTSNLWMGFLDPPEIPYRQLLPPVPPFAPKIPPLRHLPSPTELDWRRNIGGLLASNSWFFGIVTISDISFGIFREY